MRLPFVATLILTIGFCLLSASSIFAEQTPPFYEKTVLISAYYLPLPGQQHYAHGSYEADVRAGGKPHGGDGTPVYVGMIAAPRAYAIGTQIEITGLGIGTVHDRGGRLANRRSRYDLIDIWVGEGEEGLQRAWRWGVRKIKIKIYPPKSGLKESLRVDGI